MEFVVKVGRVGNSLRVTIPDDFVNSLNIADGHEMKVSLVPAEGSVGIVYIPVNTTKKE